MSNVLDEEGQIHSRNEEIIVRYEATTSEQDLSAQEDLSQSIEIVVETEENAFTKSLEQLQEEEEERKKLLEQKREQELLEESKKRERKRGEVLNEILRTEKSYVDSLEVLEKEFVTPIKKQQILKDEEFQNIFGDTEIIINLNKELLNSLKDLYRCDGILKDGVTPPAKLKYNTIGAIFQYFSHYLKSYNLYCNRYQDIFRTIEEKKNKNKKFKKFLERVEFSAEAKGQSIVALLIQPVQRIPRYNLLLTELIKYTEKTHPDFQNLNKANEAIKSVAMYVNQRLKDSSNRDKMVELEYIVTGLSIDLVQPSRRLIQEGLLAYIPHHRSVCVRYVILFNDILLLVKSRKFKQLLQYAKENQLMDANDYTEEENSTNQRQQEEAEERQIRNNSSSAFAESPGSPGSPRQEEVEEEKTVSNAFGTQKKLRKIFKQQSVISFTSTPLVYAKPLKDCFVLRDAFEVVTESKTFVFYCRNREERDNWVSSINEQVEALKKVTSSMQNKENAEPIYPEDSNYYKYSDAIFSRERASSAPITPLVGSIPTSPAPAEEKTKQRKSVSSFGKLTSKIFKKKPKKVDTGQAYVSDSEDDEQTSSTMFTHHNPSNELLNWMRHIHVRSVELRKHLEHVQAMKNNEAISNSSTVELINDDFDSIVLNPLYGFVKKGKRFTLSDEVRGEILMNEEVPSSDYGEFLQMFQKAVAGTVNNANTVFGAENKGRRLSLINPHQASSSSPAVLSSSVPNSQIETNSPARQRRRSSIFFWRK